MAKEQTPDDWQSLSKAQTFDFAKRTFVSGLFWQPLPGATARARQAEVEKMSEEQGFDLAVLRTTGAPQAGFGSFADGIRPGMLSVAAMVSKSLEVANRERSFLCAMQVPGGQWLYVAQREGVLLHDGDMLGDEGTIHARMMTDTSLTEWQTIFAPGHWGINNSTEKTFEELLPKEGSQYSFKSWWEVRPVKNNLLDRAKKYWPIAAVIVLSVAGYFGYGYWQQWQLKKEMIEVAQQEAEVREAKARAIAEHPWKKQARPAKFIEGCDAAFKQVNTFWPGNWTPKDAYCANGTLTVTWTRQENGWLEHLYAIEPKAVPADDGNTASLTIPVTMPQGDNEVVPKERERKLAMIDVSQRHGFNLALMNPRPTLLLPGQAPTVQDWKAVVWSVKNSYLHPSEVIPLLDGEGFRISLIKLTFTGGVMKWSMEGNQYVQP